MKHVVYVFINNEGKYFGDLQSSRTVNAQRLTPFYKNFDQARLFSSEEAASLFRAGILNTSIIEQMILIPLEIKIDQKQIFKAILKGV